MNKYKSFCKHGVHINIRCVKCEGEQRVLRDKSGEMIGIVRRSCRPARNKTEG